ncbi:MAG: hypothetical protein ABIP06_07455 [Pyrinomonadaceae bacterium]
MRSNCKFLYALAAFITVKLFFLSILFSADSEIFGYQVSTAEDPMILLFRLLFILFIVSPPLIVLFLYLIWKELKNRNKLK